MDAAWAPGALRAGQSLRVGHGAVVSLPRAAAPSDAAEFDGDARIGEAHLSGTRSRAERAGGMARARRYRSGVALVPQVVRRLRGTLSDGGRDQRELPALDGGRNPAYAAPPSGRRLGAPGEPLAEDGARWASL